MMDGTQDLLLTILYIQWIIGPITSLLDGFLSIGNSSHIIPQTWLKSLGGRMSFIELNEKLLFKLDGQVILFSSIFTGFILTFSYDC